MDRSFLNRKIGRTLTLGFCLFNLAFAEGGCASPGARPRVMVDSSGMTVYSFDQDVPGGGRSNCTGSCARQWPPVPVPAEAEMGDYGAVLREDGSRPLTYRGRPLYRYWKDEKPGDMRGDRFLGLWHIVPLDGYYYNPYEIPWRRYGW